MDNAVISQYSVNQISDFNISAIAVTVRGRRHIESNEPNQDAMYICTNKDNGIAVVADGLGSCRYSELGAKIAVDSTVSVLQEHLARYQHGFFMENIIAKKIVNDWRLELGAKATQADSTLLFCAVAKSYLLVGGIGDGLAQWCFTDGTIGCLNGYDLFTNHTNSLAMPEAVRKFEVQIIPVLPQHLPVIILLASDGIADDLEKNKKQLLAQYLCDKVLETFA